jgi:hypothetical protein
MRLVLQRLILCLVVGLCFTNATRAGTLSYRTTVLGDSPLVYYEFDETSGTTAANSGSTGAGNTGTINAIVTLGNETFLNGGTSYDFDGGWVAAAAVPSSLTEWTVEAWVNWDPSKTSASNFVGNDQGGWNDDVIFGIGAETGGVGVPAGSVGVIQQGAPGSTRDFAGAPLAADEWHHVAMTGSTLAGTITLYIDGASAASDIALVNDATFNGTGGFGASPNLTIGAARPDSGDAGYRPYDGLLDEVAIYGTVLNADTVAAHYDAGIVPEPSSSMLLAIGGLMLMLRRRSNPILLGGRHA